MQLKLLSLKLACLWTCFKVEYIIIVLFNSNTIVLYNNYMSPMSLYLIRISSHMGLQTNVYKTSASLAINSITPHKLHLTPLLLDVCLHIRDKVSVFLYAINCKYLDFCFTIVNLS